MEPIQALKPGSYLRHNTYRIEKVLGQGGFGITYLAYDLSLEKYMAIKEFFPKDFCDRDGTTSHVTLGTQNTAQLVDRLKGKFLKEARNIAKLDHPGIIRIHAAFEENNTAYYVMDYIKGRNLSEIVKDRIKENMGPLSEEVALRYVRKVGETLEFVHGMKMSHLDVKPANILIRETDDSPILIDFGLAKQYDTSGNQTSTTPTGISHGYAPAEQYNERGLKEFTPQTDLYSLAATLYYTLSGVVPKPAMELLEETLSFPSDIPSRLIPPISKAMSPLKRDRHGDIQEFLKDLDSSKVIPESDDEATVIEPSNIKIEKKNDQEENEGNVSKRRVPTWVWIAVFGIVAVVIGLVLFNNNRGVENIKPEASIQSAGDDASGELTGENNPTVGQILPDTLKTFEDEIDKDNTKDQEKTEKSESELTAKQESQSETRVEATSPQRKQTNGVLQLGYGTWEGEVKNGKPYGKGKIVFTSSHAVDRSSSYIANPGDYFMATYDSGGLISGKLYDSEGNLLKTIIP